MFTLISCPTCQHKFTVPEAAMGKRHSCPHCQSLFTAGKSVADAPAEVAMKLQSPAEMPMNKTMLGETAPPIKYNCPRCKKPLESPSIEAGTKKPCPSCGGRLQVPQAPPSASGPPINKTLLASDESAPKPGGFSSPSPGYTASAPPPAAAMTMPSSQTPATPAAGLSPKIYLIAGIVGGGFIFLILLACVLTLATGGSAKAEKEKYEQAIADMKKAQEDMVKKQEERDRQAKIEREIEEDKRKLRERHAEEDRRFKQQMELLAANSALSQKDKNDQMAAIKDSEKKWELQRLELEGRLKAQADQAASDRAANQAAPLAAQNRVQTVVVPQPSYYHRYHPYYGWGY